MTQFFQIPAGTPPTECKSSACRALVYWITLGSGKRMPVDCGVPGGAAPTKLAGGQGVSHFATCIAARSFRRGRKA